jgi:hypothetical protein
MRLFCPRQPVEAMMTIFLFIFRAPDIARRGRCLALSTGKIEK